MNRSQPLSIRNKFFSAMFLSSICMVLAILVAFIVVFFNFFVKKQTSFSLEKLHFVNSQIDFFTSSTTNYVRTLVSDDIVQNYATAYKNDFTTATPATQARVKETISHIIQNTNYIHSVSVYDTQFDFLLSTESFHLALDTIPLRGLKEGTWISTCKKSMTNALKPVGTFSYIQPFYSYDTGEHLGYIEVALLESAIQSVYDTSSSDASKTFLIDTNGTIQSTNSEVHSLQEFYPHFDALTQPRKQPLFFTGEHAIFMVYNHPLANYIVTQTPIQTLLYPLYTLVLSCLLLAIIGVVLYIPVAHGLAHSITHPISQLIAHTKRIKEGSWEPITIAKTDPDVCLLANAFNSMVVSQEGLKNQLVDAEKTKNKLTLSLLQEQINPHFLYNTLDNICALAEIGEIELLNQLIYNLSTFYRKGLSNGHTYITVREELDMARSYLQILQIRYYNKFDFTIDCPTDLLEFPCLKFLLQPIVENSIYHGIKNLNTKGQINIIVRQPTPTTITFLIQDNGPGMLPETFHQLITTEGTSFGLRNIHNRLQLHYGTDCDITIGDTCSAGCQIILTITTQGDQVHEA